MKELPATLILRPFDFETLATLVYAQASLDQLEDTGLAALTIVAAGIVPDHPAVAHDGCRTRRQARSGRESGRFR